MCSIEPVRSLSLSTTKKYSNGKVSLKTIEKRLNHLREELRNVTKKEIANATRNLLLEEQTNDHNEHQMQYKKRLNQLLRLYDRQVTNLNLWRFYRSDRIEQMYVHELRQSNETFQTKRIDMKSKLLTTFYDKRRYLEFEHQNVNIHSRQLFNNGQSILNSTNHSPDVLLCEGQNQQLNEPTPSQQRPTYNLRRATGMNDMMIDNSSTTTSLKVLSIFSSSTSLLPPFGGIELQRSLSDTDIEQDIKDIQHGLPNIQSILEIESRKVSFDDPSSKSYIDVRIEDGRLWYQRAWFSRNSPILLVFDELEIVPALVLTVGRNDLLIRRSGTNIKHRVSLSLLHDGHLVIRKRHCNF